eukprot:3543456-Lingulodinium_polyedra.AAC.1
MGDGGGPCSAVPPGWWEHAYMGANMYAGAVDFWSLVTGTSPPAGELTGPFSSHADMGPGMAP